MANVVKEDAFFFSSRGNEMPLRFLIGKKNKGVSDKKINNNNK